VKVLLCSPPMKYRTHGQEPTIFKGKEMGNYPSIGILSLATYLKENSSHTLKMVDAFYDSMTGDGMMETLREFDPNVVGITSYTHTLYGISQFIEAVKSYNKEIKIVIGGPHTQLFRKEITHWENVDYVIGGDGEYALLNLLNALENKSNINEVEGVSFIGDDGGFMDGGHNIIEDLDTLPNIDLGFFDHKQAYCTIGINKTCASIVTSRGCPFKCTFCLSASTDYRMRDLENVIEEMKKYISTGVTEFMIWDELFNINAKRVIEFSKKVIEHDIKVNWSFRGSVNAMDDEMLYWAKKSGCYRIQIGVEVGTEEALVKIKKGIKLDQIRDAIKRCKEHGIVTCTNWIFGFPFETREELEKSLNFAIELDTDFAEFNVLLPFPGAHEYKEGVKQNLLDPKNVDAHLAKPRADFQFQVFENHLTRKELYDFADHAYKRFYYRPKYIFNQLFKIKSFFALRKRIYGALTVFRGAHPLLKRLFGLNLKPKTQLDDADNLVS